MPEPEPMPEPELTAPGTMAAPTLTAGNGQVTVEWVAPTSDGGSAITAYELQYRSAGSESDWKLIYSGIDGTDHTITHVANNISYEVQVRAVNAVGNGPWSATATSMLPFATQVPAGTAALVLLSADIDTRIAAENLAVFLTTVEPGTYAVDESDVITITPATVPENVTPPTVDVSTGIITVTANTTAGTYLVYGSKTGTGDILFAEYFYVTVSPQDSDGNNDGGNGELKMAVTEGISVLGTEVMVDTDTTYTYADLNYIVTTAIRDMSEVFKNNSTFNGDISLWDVSSVTDINNMFNSAVAFNGDISGWDVSKVTNMSGLLGSANAFNGDISVWDTGTVTNMSNMFTFAISFNGDISLWDVSSVMNMSSMFGLASSFNGDISGWDVSSVANMEYMFNIASAFNQDLEEWKDHWTLDGNGKYTGFKTGMFVSSGVTGSLVPSWY